jgi:hypothetical protein
MTEQKPVYRSLATTIFMGTLGTFMALLSLSFPGITIAHAIGLVDVEPTWGLWGAVIGMTFTGLVSVEMFTGKIANYAGDLVKSLAERMAGKVGDDK